VEWSAASFFCKNPLHRFTSPFPTSIHRASSAGCTGLVRQRLTSVCFIQLTSSRSGSPRAHARRGFPCGSRPSDRATAWPSRLSSSSVSIRSVFQTSERSDTDVGELALTRRSCRQPSCSDSRRCGTRRVVLHRALHVEADAAVGVLPLALRNLSRRDSALRRPHPSATLCGVPGLTVSSRSGRGAAEHDEVEQRVGAEAVGAVHRHAGRLADGHQARAPRCRDCRRSW
jgi:hypothetical protein